MKKPTTQLITAVLFSLLSFFSLSLFFPSILPTPDLSFVLKPPFRPIDVLPFLPHTISLPILKSLNSAVDLLPTFVGSVASSENRIEWKGACFYENEAWLEFHNESESKYGGGTLHIKMSNAHSWTCMDLYVFATPYQFTWDYYFLSREHTINFKEWVNLKEYEFGSRCMK